MVSKEDTCSVFSDIGTVYSGAVFCMVNRDNSGSPASPVVAETPFSETTPETVNSNFKNVKDCGPPTSAYSEQS